MITSQADWPGVVEMSEAVLWQLARRRAGVTLRAAEIARRLYPGSVEDAAIVAKRQAFVFGYVYAESDRAS